MTTGIRSAPAGLLGQSPAFAGRGIPFTPLPSVPKCAESGPVAIADSPVCDLEQRAEARRG
jgi:hypothetical protein